MAERGDINDKKVLIENMINVENTRRDFVIGALLMDEKMSEKLEVHLRRNRLRAGPYAISAEATKPIAPTTRSSAISPTSCPFIPCTL